MNRLHAERNSTGVVVLGVNYDALEGETLANLVEEMDIRFPVLVIDPRLRWNVEQPSVLPTTLFINPDGELHKVAQVTGKRLGTRKRIWSWPATSTPTPRRIE